MAAECACGGTKLRMGGWMGPTPQRPYPDPCAECWPQATKREVQIRVLELIADGNAYLASKYHPSTGIVGMEVTEALHTPAAPTAREAWCAEYGHTFIEGELNCIRCGASYCDVNGHDVLNSGADQRCIHCGLGAQPDTYAQWARGG